MLLLLTDTAIDSSRYHYQALSRLFGLAGQNRTCYFDDIISNMKLVRSMLSLHFAIDMAENSLVSSLLDWTTNSDIPCLLLQGFYSTQKLYYGKDKIDGFVKSLKFPIFVIPA